MEVDSQTISNIRKKELIRKASELTRILNKSAIFWKETADDIGKKICDCGRNDYEEHEKNNGLCNNKNDEDKNPSEPHQINVEVVREEIDYKDHFEEILVATKKFKITDNKVKNKEKDYSYLNKNQSTNMGENDINENSNTTTKTNQENSMQKIKLSRINIPSSNNNILSGLNSMNSNFDLTKFSQENKNNFNINTNKNKNPQNSSESENRKLWTNEEDEILIKFVKSKPKKNWKELAKILKNKTPHQCVYRFKKLSKENTFKKWEKTEDIKLIDFVEKLGRDWKEISQYFPERTIEEIEERFFSKLDPNLKRCNFEPEEDELIIQLFAKYGNKWNEIAKHFIDRNASMIKNRYYSHIKKKIKASNLSSSKGKSNDSETITETSSYTSLSGQDQSTQTRKLQNGFFLNNSNSNSNSSNSNNSQNSNCNNSSYQSNIKFFVNNLSQNNSNILNNSSKVNIFQKNNMINFNSNYDFEYNINNDIENKKDDHEKMNEEYMNEHSKNLLDEEMADLKFINMTESHSSPSKSLKEDSLNISKGNSFNLNLVNFNSDLNKSESRKIFNNFNISNIIEQNNNDLSNNRTYHDLKEVEMNFNNNYENEIQNNFNILKKDPNLNDFGLNNYNLNYEFDLLKDFDRIEKISNDSFSYSYDVFQDTEMNMDLNNIFMEENWLINIENNKLNKFIHKNRKYIEDNEKIENHNKNFELKLDLNVLDEDENQLKSKNSIESNNLFEFDRFKSNNIENVRDFKHGKSLKKDKFIGFLNSKMNCNKLESQRKQNEEETKFADIHSMKMNLNKTTIANKINYSLELDLNRKIHSEIFHSGKNFDLDNSEILNCNHNNEFLLNDSPKKIIKYSSSYRNNNFVLYDDKEVNNLPTQIIKFEVLSRTNSNEKDNFQSNYEKIFENSNKFYQNKIDFQDENHNEFFLKKTEESKMNTNDENIDMKDILWSKYESLEKIFHNFVSFNSKQIQIIDVIQKNKKKDLDNFIKADKKVEEKRNMFLYKLAEVRNSYLKEITNRSPSKYNKDLIVRYLTLQIKILIKLINTTKIKISLTNKLEKYLTAKNLD